MLTHRLLPPALLDGVHLYRQLSSGQFQVYRVTQVLTDTVNRHRVSPVFIEPHNCVPMAFTTEESLPAFSACSPILYSNVRLHNLPQDGMTKQVLRCKLTELIRVMGAAYSGIHMYQIMRVPLLPRPLLVQLLLFVVVVVASYIQCIGCQPEKNYFTRWPVPLVVC